VQNPQTPKWWLFGSLPTQRKQTFNPASVSNAVGVNQMNCHGLQPQVKVILENICNKKAIPKEMASFLNLTSEFIKYVKQNNCSI